MAREQGERGAQRGHSQTLDRLRHWIERIQVLLAKEDGGRLHLNEWTTSDGEKRSRLQVVADAVQFLDPPKKAGDPDGGVAELAERPADRPAAGAHRRKAS